MRAELRTLRLHHAIEIHEPKAGRKHASHRQAEHLGGITPSIRFVRVGKLLANIAQADLGGAGLWLRAEPDHDPAQARALAVLLTADQRA